MRASEKYFIACISVMTLAYLWLVWKYSPNITADLYDDKTVEPQWKTPGEMGYVNDGPGDPPPGGTTGPFVKGLDYE